MWTTWQKSGWGVTCLKWVPESRVMGKSDGYFQMWRMGGFLLWNLDSVQHQTSQLKSIQKFYPKMLSKNSIQKFYPKIYPKFYPKNPSTNLSNNVKNGEIPSLTSGLVAHHQTSQLQSIQKALPGDQWMFTQSYISPKRCLSVKTMNDQLFLGCMVTDRVRTFLYQNFRKPVQNTG